MKPVLLEIEAFGPYSDLQVIDFGMLKDVNMFLIHGATGGGKTTILDAICYALYGDTSGNERDAESMRSHFAQDNQLTQVKFTFKIKDDTYYIHRIPGQNRPKKVGTGFTYQNPEAELYHLDGKDKELLASGVTKARDKIIEMIGFDSDQFRQVIMIPQGKFRDLLVAKSEERQKILGEIFQTRKYKQVEDKIREEERKLKNQVASIKERRTEQIKGIKYAQDTYLSQLIQKENIDALQVVNEAESLCKVKEGELKKISEQIGQVDESIKSLSQEITTAQYNQKKHKEKLKIQKQYDILIGEEKIYLDKEKKYKLAQKALPLRPVEIYLKDLESQRKKDQEDIVKAIETGKSLEKQYEVLKIKMDQYESQEPEIKEKESQLNKAVDIYKPNVRVLESMEKDEKKLQVNIEKIDTHLKAIVKQKKTLEKQINETDQLLRRRQGLNDLLRKQEGEVTKLSNTLGQKRQLLRLEKRLEELLKQHKKAKESARKCQKDYGDKTQAHNRLVQQWMKSQAALLAQELEDDLPCPVCGATTHPEPAKSTDKTITKEQVDQAKLALDEANELYLKAYNEQVRIETEGKETRSQVIEQKNNMGEYAVVLLESIENAYNKIEKEKKDTNQKLKKLAQLEEEMIQQKQTKVTLEQEEEKLQEEIQKHANQRISLQTNIDKIKTDIPQELQNEEKLDHHINKLEKVIEKATKLYNEGKEEIDRLRSQQIQVQTMIKEKELQLEDLKKRYEKEHIRFNEELKEAGFIDLEDYREAYESGQVLEKLNTEIIAYNKQKNAVEAQFKQVEQETRDMVLGNVEALEQDYQDLEKQKKKLMIQHQTIKLEKEHNENQVKIITKSSQEIEKLEKRYSIVGDLYRAVRGTNEKGLSFERFIQSSLFEDILLQANERLLLMSNNRYELYRSDARETKASQAGLDMEVLDTYTGKKRHVRTLSGGEGFMASLSLALGLADVVQSYAGGISLDTIFIDEGFGTLDSESLDAAIKTLIDLQKSGRLVGIISHVPELKERIGARLEVVTTQKGSQAVFHI